MMECTLFIILLAAVLNTYVWFSNGFEGAPMTIRTSLRVNPYRSQFFKYEPISLSCEEEQKGSSTGEWRVKRRLKDGKNGTCTLHWGSQTETQPCRIVAAYAGDGGVYWCESFSGESSTAVNITVTDGVVILESPLLHVTEGQNVTLRCLHKRSKDVYPAQHGFFYKDGALIRAELTGEMTLFHVSSLDEGLYRCFISDLGESPESWLAVRVVLGADPTHPDSSLLPPLAWGGVPLLLVILLVVVALLFQRQQRAVPEPSDYSTLRTHAVYSSPCGVGVSNHQRKPQSKRAEV